MIVKCHNIYGPKTILSFSGKRLGGTILEKNISGINCHGKAAPNGFAGKIGYNKLKPGQANAALKKFNSKKRPTSSRRPAAAARRRRTPARRPVAIRKSFNFRRRRTAA